MIVIEAVANRMIVFQVFKPSLSAISSICTCHSSQDEQASNYSVVDWFSLFDLTMPLKDSSHTGCVLHLEAALHVLQ